MVNELLEHELQNGVHALSIVVSKFINFFSYLIFKKLTFFEFKIVNFEFFFLNR